MELPYIPPFLHKEGGLVMSLGQFLQHIGTELMSTGAVQVWPGMPVQEALIEDGRVAGIRLPDQGVDRGGQPEAAYLPGMDVHAALTVVGDGPVGGGQLDEAFGMPEGHARREWAVGMKMVVDLAEDTALEAGTVFHTFGYPEPEIFGFSTCTRTASPRWESSCRGGSRAHPHHVSISPALRAAPVPVAALGARDSALGAPNRSGIRRRGEPFLGGDGYARIGECSGSTNVLSSTGVDEACATGVQLAEAVLELAAGGQALHPGEPGRNVCGAAARQCGWRGGGGVAERRATASSAA